MNHQHEQPTPQEQLIPQGEALSPGSEALGSQMEAVEGHVVEAAKTRASQQMGQSHQDDEEVNEAHVSEDHELDERSALKARLLKAAPAEKTMRAEVEKALIKKKDRLEGKINSYRRSRNYSMLSAAIAQLREVVRQLDELAKLGIELLRSLWLKSVHGLA